MDFSEESGCLCPFSKSGHPQIYPLYTERCNRDVKISHLLWDFNASHLHPWDSQQFLHLPSSVNTFQVSNPFFSPCSSLSVFLKVFLVIFCRKWLHSFEKFLLFHTAISIRGFPALSSCVKYLMRYNSRDFSSHGMRYHLHGCIFASSLLFLCLCLFLLLSWKWSPVPLY